MAAFIRYISIVHFQGDVATYFFLLLFSTQIKKHLKFKEKKKHLKLQGISTGSKHVISVIFSRGNTLKHISEKLRYNSSEIFYSYIECDESEIRHYFF